MKIILIATTDGTVSKDKGGTAVTIHSNKIPDILQIDLLVDSHHKYTINYRTELMGLLVTLITNHVLLQITKTKCNNLIGYIYYDNKLAVQQYEILSGTLPLQ